MQLTDRISEQPIIVDGKVTEEKIGFSTPAFSAAMNLLKQIEPVTPKLTVDLENKMLEKIGFGFYDIAMALKENLSSAYDQKYIKIFDAYLSALDKNIKAGAPVSFFGSNGSGNPEVDTYDADHIALRLWCSAHRNCQTINDWHSDRNAW